MADLDITQNVAGNAHLSLKQGVSISQANANIMQNIASMKTYLHANGYTAARTSVMTKNDLIRACREKLGLV